MFQASSPNQGEYVKWVSLFGSSCHFYRSARAEIRSALLSAVERSEHDRYCQSADKGISEQGKEQLRRARLHSKVGGLSLKFIADGRLMELHNF